MVLLEQGKPSQALAYLERALELEPDHQASLLNSAIVLQEMAANDKGHQDVKILLNFENSTSGLSSGPSTFHLFMQFCLFFPER